MSRKKFRRKNKQQNKKKKQEEENKKEEKFDENEADLLANEGIIATCAVSSKNVHRNAKDINVLNVSVSFHGSVLLDETDLVLNYGNRYGLIGFNGCGKSTLLKALGARSFPMPASIDLYYLEGEIEASDLTALQAVMSVDKARESLEAESEQLNEYLTDEDKMNELVEEISKESGDDENITPESMQEEIIDRLQQIYERLEELDAAMAETRASKILTGLGFTNEMQEKKTREFSGGWRMRIALARALFLGPSLLLLDNPTNHLDLEAVVWLEEYLKKFNKILLMVSHSQDFLNNVCTHIIHFYHQKLIYYTGNYDQYVQTRQELEDNQMKRYKWEQDQIKEMKRYIARFGHGTSKMAKQAQSKEKTLAKMERAGLTEKVMHEKPLDFNFPDPGPIPPPVLQFQQVSFGYPNSPLLYENLSFGVDLDSRVALVGPNGAGKSTLLKLMTNQLSPVNGNIRPHSHLRISMFTQHFIDMLDLSLTPLDFMLQEYEDLNRDTARGYLGRFGVSGSVQLQVMEQLSDGQKSRVIFAKIAKDTPHLLLLDEPTNHLDMESIDSLARAIQNFEGGMVLVSHDMRLISQVAEEIWVCDNQTIVKYVGDIQSFKMELRQSLDSEEGQSNHVAGINTVPLV